MHDSESFLFRTLAALSRVVSAVVQNFHVALAIRVIYRVGLFFRSASNQVRRSKSKAANEIVRQRSRRSCTWYKQLRKYKLSTGHSPYTLHIESKAGLTFVQGGLAKLPIPTARSSVFFILSSSAVI